MISKTSLCSLIYFSRSCLIGNSETKTQQLSQLIKSARKNNEFGVITSLLISDREWFMQVLEGERNAIQSAFARIGVGGLSTHSRDPGLYGLGDELWSVVGADVAWHPLAEMNRSESTSMTSIAFSLRATRMARHSRVNSLRGPPVRPRR